MDNSVLLSASYDLCSWCYLALFFRIKQISVSSTALQVSTMAADSDTNAAVRQRRPEKGTEDLTSASQAQAQEQTSATKKGKKKTNKSDDNEDKVEYENRWVDAARVLTFLLFVSCGLSYLVSSGESFFWSMQVPPKYMRLEWWQSQLVCSFPVSPST